MPHDVSSPAPSHRGRRRPAATGSSRGRRAMGWLAGAGGALLAGFAVVAARDLLRSRRRALEPAPRPGPLASVPASPLASRPSAGPPVSAPAPPVAPATSEQPAEPAVSHQPAPQSLATPGQPDDLTRIEGVGPKISAALSAAGLASFGAVAAASEAELRAALEASGLRFAPSLASWPEQAARLAAASPPAR